MREQTFKHASIRTYEDDEVLFATYVPHLEIDMAIARELVRDRVEFTGGRPHYVLIDFTNVKSVTKEARDYMNSPEGGLKNILGGAFLSNNVVATLFINLYLKINNPDVPARFFTNKDEAVKWLTRIKAEAQHVPVPL